MKSHLLILGLCILPSLTNAQQPKPPSLSDACKSYTNAMVDIRSPRVPFPVAASVIEQTKVQAKMCETPPPSRVDPGEVQDAANKIAVAAATYKGEKP